jgi:hypothetical protein
MRWIVVGLLLFSSTASAELFDDFEYATLEEGGWRILEQTGTIAEIRIVEDSYFSGSRSLYIEGKNQDHYWDVACDRNKFSAVQKDFPTEWILGEISLAFRAEVYWQGSSQYPYNHGESAGLAYLGLHDTNGCVDSGVQCIDACSSWCMIYSKEWAENGLEYFYDHEEVGADGRTWFIVNVPVPETADPNSLMLDIIVETQAWSQNWEYPYTHIKLWVDCIQMEISGVPTEATSWSTIKALY